MSELLKPAAFCSAGDLLYLNEDLSDLSLIVKNGTTQFRFPVHALVLSAESSIFRTMLNEMGQEEIKQIIISDITASTAELLLRYMYSGKLDVECWTEAVDLLQAAYTYKVKDLVYKCGRFLEDVISLSNVCYIYNKASNCSLPSLQDKCLKFILDAGFIVLKSNSFELLSKECVMDVVSSSDLNIDSELTVFKTLLKWARLECCRTGKALTEANILNELKPFLQHVCVDDMSDADKSALPPGILSCVKPNNRNRIGFSVLESLLNYSSRLEFETNQECSHHEGGIMSCLRFSVDKPISLLGLSLTIVFSVIPYEVELTLVKENNPRTTMFNHTVSRTSWIANFAVDGITWFNTELLLKQPVFLKSNDTYHLIITNYGIEYPKMTLAVNTVKMPSGIVSFSVHGEEIWGVTSLICI